MLDLMQPSSLFMMFMKQLFACLEKWLKAQYQNYAALLAQPLRQDQVM